MKLLEVRDLAVSIGGAHIIHRVDMSLDAGQILGICGASGAGKSMAGLAIAGLLPRGAVRRGHIRLGGRRLDALGERDYGRIRGAHIGMIFQEPQTALNPLMSIGGQVAEVFRHHRNLGRKAAYAKAEAILRSVGLADVAPHRLPHEISGGQRQRVIIAMAIALEPSLLIADEPTTALDTTTQAEILALLKGLVEAHNLAMILITHDPAVMNHMADKVLIMEGGTVAQKGGVEILKKSLPYPARADEPPAKSKADSPPPDPSPLMTLDAVSYAYPKRGLGAGHRGVRDISFTLHRGELVGLVGASGSGKTTLGRLMLGLLGPDSGHITTHIDAPPNTPRDTSPDMPPDGRLNDPAHTSPNTPPQGHLGAVFQDPYASFNPRHRIGRLVAEPLAAMPHPPPLNTQQHMVAEMLAAVGIDPDWQGRFIHEYSGGQRQRIAFARAMITRPGLIILDEPVSALDADLRGRLLRLMAERARAHGIACVFISHDLSVVRAVCPRVMVLDDGEIVEDGATEDVFNNPSHPATCALVDATLDWATLDWASP